MKDSQYPMFPKSPKLNGTSLQWLMFNWLHSMGGLTQWLQC